MLILKTPASHTEIRRGSSSLWERAILWVINVSPKVCGWKVSSLLRFLHYYYSVPQQWTNISLLCLQADYRNKGHEGGLLAVALARVGVWVWSWLLELTINAFLHSTARLFSVLLLPTAFQAPIMIPEGLVLIVMASWFAFWICGKYHGQ